MDIYEIKTPAQLIKGNRYVGRGIVLGQTPDGGKAVTAYFIMGRSANSRNRVFALEDGVLYTRPFDESKVADPSLIIYAALRRYENKLIVTNGDQTDTVRDFLAAGKTFEDALRTRTFEPDPPNWTPRISALADVRGGKAAYRMSILKSDDGNGDSVQRFFWEYPQPVAGEGHFLHTYRCDGNPIPSFEGDPEKVCIPDAFDAFTALLWDNLNADNKVSLFTAFLNLETGEAESTAILNKNV